MCFYLRVLGDEEQRISRVRQRQVDSDNKEATSSKEGSKEGSEQGSEDNGDEDSKEDSDEDGGDGENSEAESDALQP